MGGSSGGGGGNTTTTSQPWPGQASYLLGMPAYGGTPPGLFPGAADLYANYIPQYYPGAQVAPQGSDTRAAQQLARETVIPGGGGQATPGGTTYEYVPGGAFAGGVPQDYWGSTGFQPGTTAAGLSPYDINTQYNAPRGSVQLAKQNIGFGGAPGQGGYNAWAAANQGAAGGLEQEIARVEAARNAYNIQTYGADVRGGEHDLLGQIDPVTGLPRGMVRHGMRELGFEGPWGGGRGTAWREANDPAALRQATQGLLAPGGVRAVPGVPPSMQAQAAPGAAAATQAATAPIPALTQASQGAQEFVLGDVLYPESNPAMQAYIDAVQGDIFRNLQEDVLPSLRSGAIGAGQTGSSREGVAEGIAAGRAQDAAGDAAAMIASQGYGQGLGALSRGLVTAPGIGQFQTMPSQVLDTVGQQNQLYQQAQIDAQMRRWAFEQGLPYEQLREYASIVGGGGYGGVSSTAGPGTQSNQLLTTLGGAAAGASLASTLGAPVAVGAGLGLLAGLFG